MYRFLPPLIASALALFIAAHPGTAASSETSWSAVPSLTSEDLTKIFFGEGRFVALAPGSGGNSTLLRSSDGTFWEEAILPAGLDLVDLAFGGGQFFAVGELGGEPVALYSADGEGWTMIEDMPQISYPPLLACGYAQGGYWMIPTWGGLHYSADLSSWISSHRGPVLDQLVGYENRLLTVRNDFVTSSLGGTPTWPVRARFSYTEALSVAAGAERAVALLANGQEKAFAVSGDGVMWVAFEHGPADVNAVIAVGDRFLAVGPEVILSSTDGARWADRSAGAEGAVLRSAAAGSGQIVVVGDNGVILRRSDHLEPVILGQPPAETNLAEGQPLLLAVEVEGGENMSVKWQRNGVPIGAPGKSFRKTAVTSDDAGTYTAMVTDDSGSSVESAPASVVVTGPLEEQVPWQQVASFSGQFSRLAAGEGGIFVFAHPQSFEMSLREPSPSDDPLAGAWSENGLHWRQASLPKQTFSVAAGSVRDMLWIGGQGTVAFSEDGIAWRQGRLSMWDTSEWTTLVGEHEGKLFATNGRILWWSEDGESWTNRSGPVTNAGGYFLSEEGLLTVAGSLGVWQWQDGLEWWRKLHEPFEDSRQPRLIGTGENLLFMARDRGALAISKDLANWTTLFAAQTRDGIYTGDEFIIVGEGFARSSSDGVWWADRSAGLGSTVLSGVAQAGDFLFAVGDEGKIFRRSAILEPAFYQQPLDVTASVGQPARLTARFLDDGVVQVQWYRVPERCPSPSPAPCDDTPIPIDGAIGPVLAFSAVEAQHAGSYLAVISNSRGSVTSRLAVLTLEDKPPMNPWVQIGEIPPLPSGSGPNPDSFVSGNGVTLGIVPHYPTTFVATEDGIGWLRGAIANRPSHLSFAGGIFFASGNEGPHPTLISSDGFAWEPTSLPGVNSVGFADGVYVVATNDGLYWSIDGETWVLGQTASNVRFLANGNGSFVAIGGDPLSAWVSVDGKQWTVHDLPAAALTQTLISFAFGNGRFLLGSASSSSTAGFFYSSLGGEDWTSSQQQPLFAQMLYSAGNFWALGGSLGTSTDGSKWVHRSGPPTSALYRRLVSVDQTDVTYQASERVFRRSGLLEPVIFPGPAPSAQGAFPGEDVVLESPDAHGNEDFLFQWRRNGEPLPGASDAVLTLKEITEEDRGLYTVEISNASGSASANLLVRYLGLYSEWADYFSLAGQPLDPHGDPGGRGVENLLRYAFQLDPIAPDRSLLPHLVLEEADGDVFTVMNFQLLAGAEDFNWTLMVSSNLLEWEELETAVVESDERDLRRRQLSIRDNHPLGGRKRFYRLQVEAIDSP